MDSAARLQLTARITYYIAWVFALWGGLVQLGLGFLALHSMTKRNLFEAALMFFVISLASAARGLFTEKVKDAATPS
jgi:hypothetical protein